MDIIIAFSWNNARLTLTIAECESEGAEEALESLCNTPGDVIKIIDNILEGLFNQEII